MSPRLILCRHWANSLEKAIARFLAANDAGEMGNRDKAIERMRRLMEQRRPG